MTIFKPCLSCGRPISIKLRDHRCHACSRLYAQQMRTLKQPDCKKLEETWKFIQENQPCKASDIAKLLYGETSGSGPSALMTLEGAGYLLSEDDHGLVSIFGRREVEEVE